MDAPETDASTPDLLVRTMGPDEVAPMREVAIEAFGDEHIGTLVDSLRASWAWSDELSFVAEADGRIVGQVLYTRARLDAMRELVEVLVLSPIGVVPSITSTMPEPTATSAPAATAASTTTRSRRDLITAAARNASDAVWTKRSHETAEWPRSPGTSDQT